MRSTNASALASRPRSSHRHRRQHFRQRQRRRHADEDGQANPELRDQDQFERRLCIRRRAVSRATLADADRHEPRAHWRAWRHCHREPGVRHRITFTVDPISREPRLDHQTEAIDDAGGTKVTIFLPVSGDALPLQRRVRFQVGQPARGAVLRSARRVFRFVRRATAPAWTKWRPTDPTSAHWYDLSALKTLIAAEIDKANRDRSPQRTVADFIGEFRGLASTVKRRDICEAAQRLARLLDAFLARRPCRSTPARQHERASKPVKARDLGVLGERMSSP